MRISKSFAFSYHTGDMRMQMAPPPEAGDARERGGRERGGGDEPVAAAEGPRRPAVQQLQRQEQSRRRVEEAVGQREHVACGSGARTPVRRCECMGGGR